MKNSLSSNVGLALLRVAGSGMLLTHGIPKIGRLFGEGPIEFANPIGIGPGPSLFLVTFAEVVCAILIMIGYKTRWASVPIIIQMFILSFIVKAGEPFKEIELPLLYAVVFLAIFLMGPGSYSVDRK